MSMWIQLNVNSAFSYVSTLLKTTDSSEENASGIWKVPVHWSWFSTFSAFTSAFFQTDGQTGRFQFNGSGCLIDSTSPLSPRMIRRRYPEGRPFTYILSSQLSLSKASGQQP